MAKKAAKKANKSSSKEAPAPVPNLSENDLSKECPNRIVAHTPTAPRSAISEPEDLSRKKPVYVPAPVSNLIEDDISRTEESPEPIAAHAPAETTNVVSEPEDLSSESPSVTSSPRKVNLETTCPRQIIASLEKSGRGVPSGFSYIHEKAAETTRRGRTPEEKKEEIPRYSTRKKIRQIRSKSAPKPKRKIGVLDEFMESEHSLKYDMDTDSNKARTTRGNGQLGDFLASEAAASQKRPQQENDSNLAQAQSCASSQGSGKRQRMGSATRLIRRSKSASSVRSSKETNLPPSMWAITYAQLLEVDRKALEVFGTKDYPKKTMRDIVQRIVVPVCSRTGKSFALSINEEGAPVDTFVSHSWDGSFHKFVNTIKKTFRASVRKPNLWICAFALMQGGNDETISNIVGSKKEPLQEAPFVLAIQAASMFCIVRNSNTDVYSRIWCVAELMFAKFYGLFDYPGKTQVTGPDVFAKHQTSVLDAQASRLEDRDRVLRVLMIKFDREEIDNMVQQLRTHKSL